MTVIQSPLAFTRRRRAHRRIRALLALGATLAVTSVIAFVGHALPVPVSKDLALNRPELITAHEMVLDFQGLPVSSVVPVSGLKSGADPRSIDWDLADGADEGTIRVKNGAHMGSTWYDVLITSHPHNREYGHWGVFGYNPGTKDEPLSTINWGNKVASGPGTPDSGTDLTVRIVHPNTNTLVTGWHDGVTAVVDIDGWLRASTKNQYGPDKALDDEGIQLGNGWTSASIAPDAHLTVNLNDGKADSFTGNTDEDNSRGDGEGPAFSRYHNLQHMVKLHFNSPTLTMYYHSHWLRWSSFAIRTNPPIFKQQHKGYRTIVMHEPVNRTETQSAVVQTDNNGSWSTDEWDDYKPEVPNGYRISSGPSDIPYQTVTHTTPDTRIDIYYEPIMSPAHDSHTVTRTIVMHGPVNRTEKQTSTVTFTGTRNEATGAVTGRWTTSSWPAYTPATSNGWTAHPGDVSYQAVTHDTRDTSVDIYYATTVRFKSRTPSCDGRGGINYSDWRETGSQQVTYNHTLNVPGDPHSLPSSWADGAWYTAPDGGTRLTSSTRITTANTTYYWRANAPSASYTVTTKSRLDGKTLETHRVSGVACAITTPNPVIPDGWVPDGNPDAPDAAIPVDGRAPSDVTVWVRRPGVSQLPQTGGWRLTMMVGVPVLLTLLLGGAALMVRMRPHAGREH